MPVSKTRKKQEKPRKKPGIQLNRMPGTVLSWESQVSQYPELGEANAIQHFAGFVQADKPPIFCLLWRDGEGIIRGILNYYSVDYPPHEQAGARNTFVHPDWRRQGIATKLHEEADRLWGPINLSKQTFTKEGEAFMRAYRRKH